MPLILGVDPGQVTGLAYCETAMGHERVLWHGQCGPSLDEFRATMTEFWEWYDAQGLYWPRRAVVQVPCWHGQPFGFWGKRNARAIVCNGELAGEIVGHLRHEWEVKKVLPRRGAGCKMDAEMWRATFHLVGKSPNGHVRDAAALTLGGG